MTDPYPLWSRAGFKPHATTHATTRIGNAHEKPVANATSNASLLPQDRRRWDGKLVRFPFCTPEELNDVAKTGGLDYVEETKVEVEPIFRDIDDYWSPFTSGEGAARGYCVGLDAGSREELRGKLRSELTSEGSGAMSLRARAWAVRGNVN